MTQLSHLLSVRDLDRDDAVGILDLAEDMADVATRAVPKLPTLRGRIVANLFFEDSTRTRLSFEAAAKRLESWIAEAKAAGARLLCGGGRKGNMLEASVLENVPDDAKLSCQEAFGPVTVLARFTGFDEAIAAVNASDYGLQAGVFTNDLAHATRAWGELDVGGVIINDIPSFRVDNMPYGGVKLSGLGREGIRYAIEDMTERRLMVLRDR
jgi:acyl-CoA reductase-like NAD-dependent aldehyde dehydrogenase